MHEVDYTRMTQMQLVAAVMVDARRIQYMQNPSDRVCAWAIKCTGGWIIEEFPSIFTEEVQARARDELELLAKQSQLPKPTAFSAQTPWWQVKR